MSATGDARRVGSSRRGRRPAGNRAGARSPPGAWHDPPSAGGTRPVGGTARRRRVRGAHGAHLAARGAAERVPSSGSAAAARRPASPRGGASAAGTLGAVARARVDHPRSSLTLRKEVTLRYGRYRRNPRAACGSGRSTEGIGCWRTSSTLRAARTSATAGTSATTRGPQRVTAPLFGPGAGQAQHGREPRLFEEFDQLLDRERLAP